MRAKNQHYISQFYLKKFSTRNEQVFCFDKKQQKKFTSNVKNICSENGFNDIISDEFSISSLEEALSSDENEISESLNRIIDSGKFETNHDRKNILMLAALFYLRNPHAREEKDKTINHLIKICIEYFEEDDNYQIPFDFSLHKTTHSIIELSNLEKVTKNFFQEDGLFSHQKKTAKQSL
jgi:predicted transcriptional regulator